MISSNITPKFLGLLITRVAIPIAILLASSCKKFSEVEPPPTQISEGNVYKSDNTAIAVLTALYSQISASPYYANNGFTNISKLLGLSADEFNIDLNFADEASAAHFTNSLAVNNLTETGTGLYQDFYYRIYTCNSVIEGVTKSESLSDPVKKQLIGEALFMRGLFYFYLTNLYGEVPLVTITNYEKTRVAPKVSQVELYEQIIHDLKEAQEHLSKQFLSGSLSPYDGESERTRPTYWSATALLARVLLFNERWSEAEDESTKLIENTSLFDTTNASVTFLKDSKEAIWQLQPVLLNSNTEDAKLFNLSADPQGIGFSKFIYLSDFLINSIELNDIRSIEWIGIYFDGVNTYHYPLKYKQGENSLLGMEYLIVLRLAEQYLIRAEARAHLNDIEGGKADLNVIRHRAHLPDDISTNASELISSIIKERRIEFFSEWGHRWLDLKRTNTVDVVMSSVTPNKSGEDWQPYQKLYPVPFNDILRNPNFGGQNTGY